MSWLKEAQNIIDGKSSQSQALKVEYNFIDDEASLIKEIKSLYDNATQREIEKAINLAKESLEPGFSKKDFMNFIRIKLED